MNHEAQIIKIVRYASEIGLCSTSFLCFMIERMIVELDCVECIELGQIEISPNDHGLHWLLACGGKLLYSDTTSGCVRQNSL